MSDRHPATPAVVRVFEVGRHRVQLSCSGGRWTVTVDAVPHEKWYMNQAAAWEAGVHEADRLDRSGLALLGLPVPTG